jgi:hypothetical protein
MKSMVRHIVLVPVVTVALAGIMASCSSVNDFAPAQDTEAGKTNMFLLSGLTIDPGEVAARDEVLITAHVTNVGTVDDAYDAKLNINGVTESSDKVLVPAGTTQTLTFALFKDTPGMYKVSLGPLKGRFSVTETVAAVPNLPTAPVPGGASCCGIGGGQSPATQTGASCCGVPVQNSSYAPASGCGCGR